MKASRAFSLSIVVAIGLGASALRTPPLARGTQSTSAQSKKTYSPSPGDGVIAGTINFEGEAPLRKPLSMDADPACAEMNPAAQSEDIFVSGGKLANVFVYVKGGSSLDEYEFTPPTTPAVLEHRRCQYVPRLLGVQVNQPMKIVNADPTTHNTHPAPKANVEWNRSQSPSAEPIETQGFARRELFIPFKCNQHPWERAYVGVFPHPFFAVSGSDGTFRIEGLPPGEYTLVAWHEKFGEKVTYVTVAPYQELVVDFTFKPEATDH